MHVIETLQTDVRYLSTLRSMPLQVVESCTWSDGGFQQTIQNQECCPPRGV